MNKSKVLFSLLLFCFAGLATVTFLRQKTPTASRSVLCRIPTGNCQDSPLKAEIELVQTSIRNHEEFSVSTALYNKGSDVWMLQVWACGYSNQWTSDNPFIVIGESCLNNSFQKIGLKPDEVFKKAVKAHVELLPDSDKSQSGVAPLAETNS